MRTSMSASDVGQDGKDLAPMTGIGRQAAPRPSRRSATLSLVGTKSLVPERAQLRRAARRASMPRSDRWRIRRDVPPRPARAHASCTAMKRVTWISMEECSCPWPRSSRTAQARTKEWIASAQRWRNRLLAVVRPGRGVFLCLGGIHPASAVRRRSGPTMLRESGSPPIAAVRWSACRTRGRGPT